MKKGKQYSAGRIKRYSIVRSGFFYALLAFGFTFLAAAASAALDLAELIALYAEGSPDIKAFSELFFSVATAIITGYGAIRSGKELFRAYFDRQLVHQNTWKDEISAAVQKKHTRVFEKNGYEWKSYRNEIYLCSDAVDKCLLSHADHLSLKVLPHKPRMNEEQRRALYQIVSEKIAQGKNIFNGNLVRLRTDMLAETQWKFPFGGADRNTVWVQKTDYFSNLTSNDLIYDQIFESDFTSVYDGKRMTVDRYGMLYNLTDSPAANIVGASTLAITADGYLVVNCQHNRNDVNNESCVPSGSGSADFEDLFATDRGANEALLRRSREELRNRKRICGEKRIAALTASQELFPVRHGEYSRAKEAVNRAVADVRYYRSMKRYENNFGAFLARAMERELMEESHLAQSQLQKTVVCGYIRLLNRGGKPDFFGFTFLSCDRKTVAKAFLAGKTEVERKELRKKHDITDFNEVREQLFVPLEDALSEIPLEELFRKYFGDGNVSVQLYYLFSLLRKNPDLAKKRIG